MAATKEQLPPAILEGVRFFTRNFSGLAGKYNAAGKRNFTIRLDDEQAELMEKDGWNVKWKRPLEEGLPEQPILEVKVRFPEAGEKGSTPKVMLITSRGKTQLKEDMLPILDWAEVSNVDLVIRAYHYNVNDKTGISAYCKSVYVTVVEDALELKYADVPDSGSANIVIPHDEEPPWEE